jgi:hypothetical protein
MLTRIVKVAAILALVAGLFTARFPGYANWLQFVVSASAVVVLWQAASMRRYRWMAWFVGVACLFNPVVPVQLSAQMLAIASTLAVLLFFFSLELLQPRLVVAPLTADLHQKS